MQYGISPIPALRTPRKYLADLGGVDAEIVKGLLVHRSALVGIVGDEQDVLAYGMDELRSAQTRTSQ